jgi:anti-anti-sigma factor
MLADDFTLRELEDVQIVQIDTDNLLGINEVNRIGSALNALVKAKPRNLVLDLSKVRYAGSAALGMLLSLSKQLQGAGAKLALAGTQHIDTLFKVSRTVAVFEVAPDVNAGVQMMKK